MTDTNPGTALEPHSGGALTPAEKWLSEQGHFTYTTLDDGRRMIEVDDALKNSVILLGPVANIVPVTSNWTPQVRPMRITPGEGTFKVGSVKVGNGYDDVLDLDATMWAKLGALAGVERVKTTTSRHQTGMQVTVTARKRGPDGNWTYTSASRDAEYDVEAELIEIDAREKWEKFGKPKNKPEPSALDIRKLVLRMRQFLQPTLETKAFSRCVKALVGVSSFRKSALVAKPLMAIAWVMTPDLNDPGSRALVQMQYDTANADLFGEREGDGALVLGAGDHMLTTEEVAVTTGDLGMAGYDEPEPAPESPEPPAEAPPEETWDIGEETPAVPTQEPSPPKPASGFQPSSGPFAGKSVEEIVATREGREWLVLAHGKLRQADKKQQVLDWLSWACERAISSETLQSAVAGPVK
jgi:hypothetical protein